MLFCHCGLFLLMRQTNNNNLTFIDRQKISTCITLSIREATLNIPSAITQPQTQTPPDILLWLFFFCFFFKSHTLVSHSLFHRWGVRTAAQGSSFALTPACVCRGAKCVTGPPPSPPAATSSSARPAHLLTSPATCVCPGETIWAVGL